MQFSNRFHHEKTIYTHTQEYNETNKRLKKTLGYRVQLNQDALMLWELTKKKTNEPLSILATDVSNANIARNLHNMPVLFTIL